MNDLPPPPQLFLPNEVYSIMEIAEKTKSSKSTVIHIMKQHKIKYIRFGSIKYWGADLNRVIEAETYEA